MHGAAVLSFVGAVQPASLGDWKMEGIFTKTSGVVTFSAEVDPGSQVWFTAYWVNGKGQSSPAAAPQTTNLGGNIATAA